MDAKADLVKTEPKLRATIQQAEGELRAKKYKVERLGRVAGAAGRVCPLVRKGVSRKIICSKHLNLVGTWRGGRNYYCLKRMEEVKC